MIFLFNPEAVLFNMPVYTWLASFLPYYLAVRSSEGLCEICYSGTKDVCRTKSFTRHSSGHPSVGPSGGALNMPILPSGDVYDDDDDDVGDDGDACDRCNSS
jgi:hypothetical protein